MCAEPNEQGNRSLPDDAELMSRLSAGDMTALEAVYMRYGTMVRAAIHRTNPRVHMEDAEELCQEVFLSLVRSADRFDSGRSLKPWLYGIAVHAASGKRRSDARHLRLLEKHHTDQTVLGGQTAGSVSQRTEDQQRLSRAFATLSSEHHEVMVLHAVEGFSGEEISHILGIEVNTVWTRLHRARRILTGVLGSRNGETP